MKTQQLPRKPTMHWIITGFMALALLLTALAMPASAQIQWSVGIGIEGDRYPGIVTVGGSVVNTGYYGQYRFDPTSYSGLVLALYRREGVDGWTGPTGFYGQEFNPPMPAGGQTTYSGIYLWAQNYTPRGGDKAWVGLGSMPPYEFPSWYNILLVLDYVPESLNYTGPTSFDIRSLTSPMFLPVAQVTDPLQGTRMHLTVYAGPIPEPSSLAALAFGVSGLAVAFVRRRRWG